MNKEFKKIDNGDTTRYILESASGGGTSAGSVASVSKPMSGVQRRDNLLVQDTSQKLTPRSPVAHAAQKVAKGSGRHTDRKQQSKQVRGEKHKKQDFAENQDHEISMAGSELHSIFQDAKQLHSMIKTKSEEEGLDAWQQSKITKAADYLNSVLQSLQHEMMGEGWSQKYKNSINCSHPKGFSQRAHCAGKRKHNESVEMEMTCPDCGMCRTHGNLNEIKKGQKDSNGFTKCWPGKHAVGTKKGKNGGQVRNCKPNEGVTEDATPTTGLQSDGKYYNKAGRLVGKWNGRTLILDPEFEQYHRDEGGFGDEEIEQMRGTFQHRIQKLTAPSEDRIKYVANELEKSDIQADRPRKSRNEYRELAVQMLSDQQGVAEGLNEFAPDSDDDGDDDGDEYMEANFVIVKNGKVLKGIVRLFPGVTTDVEYHLDGTVYSKTEMDNVTDYDEFITNAKDFIDEIIQLNGDGNHFVEKQGVAEGGPFSYGKPPRKGSVADLAAKRRKEQDRKTPPIEPKDQMVGNAKVTKDTKEGLKQMLRKVDPTIKSRLRSKADRLDDEGDEVHQDLKSMGMEPHDAMTRNMDPEKYYRNADRYRRLADKDVDETQLAELDRPSGKLFIIVKADNAGATHVFGDFGSFPQDVMHKVSKRGTRDKSGAKTKLKIDFLFDDFRSTIQQLRTIFRDVDFVGAEAAEFIIHSSALKSDQGEDVKHLRDYIEAGDDRRMKMHQKPEDDEDDDGETTGGNMLRIDPETGAARKVVGVKPQTQMGGKSVEQPGMTTYRFKDPVFARQLRGMNLGFNIKNDSITVDQKQKQELLRMLGDRFSDVFTNKEQFKEQDIYLESLSAALEQKLSVNDTPEVWRDDFEHADPVKYPQFRNKTVEKKHRMADVARYRQIQKK
jgi:hypothetical protein